MDICEVLVVGAGVLGLTIANELLQRGCENIIIIEKEEVIGKHASGRNSGVLHAGIYYTPDSLKAKYCVNGNKLMKEFCFQNGVALNVCGKVLVADSKQKLENLEVIKKRADINGVSSRFIDKSELKRIEPFAFTYQKALYSPDTAVFNPVEVLKALETKVLEKNCNIKFNTKFIRPVGNSKVLTTTGQIKYRVLINTSGAYADKIAHEFEVGKQYRSLPFMGTYLEVAKEKSYLVNGNIYPVPDIRNPFLGVHLTKSIDGRVYIGPTALPVLGRENYNFFEGLDLESLSIFYMNMRMFLTNDSFRSNAVSEMKKFFSDFTYKEAKKLVPSINKYDIKSSDKKGIRPQLVNLYKNELVMDYKVIKESDTIHVLNAISPAFTSSMSFAKYICDLIG
ncbi:MAG: L-2-hydroxyglutarate oxidase [Candidatus Dadabacteria bacterium]|nr:L-2-hydroxyglutarate oxidase [Candidatus Dadabacteria bacterium]NIQ14145.1 L-2-hydroxyglutarate oxidase [Candidatus Dadabacteria bacterium]